MSSVNYENQILDAIETMVDNAVNKAGYDKTIQATILSLEDEAIGKYRARYQDSDIEVYSSNINIKYSEGTLVYVTIPNGDFNQTKIILDTVDKETTEQKLVLDEDEWYEMNGGNAIAATQEFGVCSYKAEDKRYLYKRKNSEQDDGVNDINFDVITFAESIADTNLILCGGKFKTMLSDEQQKKGNFGLVFEMEFTDNITGELIEKNYVLDINKMSGSPYSQSDFTRQVEIFEINNENFVDVKGIYLFAKNFPYNLDDASLQYDDILVKDLELYGLIDLSESTDYNLILNKLDKGYFNDISLETDTVTIESSLKIANKVIDNPEIEYYWFKENGDIKTDSIEYVNYAGEGWECVNEYTEVDDETRMWITNNTQYSITKAECVSECTNIKCIAVKNSEILAENDISVYVYAEGAELAILSDLGAQFYFDNGRPTLTCYVDKEENLEDYTYSWSMVDVNGTVTELSETYDENIEYNEAIADRDLIQAKIATEEIMPAAVQADLDALQVIIDKYDDIQRVEKNKLINIDMRQVTNYTTFKCLVKKQDLVVGTAAITLHNRLLTEGEYVLNIINGTQVFTYDDLGVSPVNSSLERPITIEPLTFTITDNLGYLLSDIVLEECDVQWEVPTENTLLVGESSNNLTLNYGIADEYNINKTNNDIKLTVKYKDLTLEAKTNFVFVKQGEPGTNGSDIICKIVPNTNNNNFNDYPMILNGNLNYTAATAKKWFKIQLWENGQKIFDGTDSSGSFAVEWRVLKNKYNNLDGTSAREDSSSITITKTNDNKYEFSYAGYKTDQPANIIQGIVTYQGINYYCTIPMITAETSANYGVKLIKNTGFRYVCYSSDGRNPVYDDAEPFTLQVTRVINGFTEDVSTVSNDYRVSYSWLTYGRIRSGNSWIADKHLIAKDSSAGNSKIYFPKDDYNGECLTDAIEVKIKDKNNTEIAKIYIPVHFYLNRHGLAGIESWDGNSITIDNDAGRILTPQAGAGLKESDGTFTGVYMGAVRERGRTAQDVGLIGYHKGVRSLFLNSKNGSAIFGKGGNSGQIIIDPQTNNALLYSNNFWKSYHTDDDNVGLPINYTSSNEKGSGMIIDLAKPEIRFGSGKFKVDLNGNITAKGGGNIAGWTLSTSNGKELLSSQGVVLNGTDGTIYSNGKSSFTSTNSGFYIGSNGFALGYSSTTQSAPFSVTNGGALTSTSGSIAGWTINPTKLYKGKVGISSDNSGNTTAQQNSKIAFWAGDSTSANAPFRVNYGGEITATKATIEGTLTAKAGSKIGPWNITDTSIWYGNQNYGNANGLYFGTSGLSLADKFKVSSAGAVTASNITITGGSLNINNTFKVSNTGALTATEASITGTVNATSGTFGNGTNKITIGTNNTSNSAIYYGKSNFNTNASGFYIGTNGIALGAVADGTSAFQVTTAGALTAKSATISGAINATSGTFGNGSNKITIGTNGNESNIHSGSKTTFNSTNSGFYIGTDGIAFGAYSSGHSPFEVTTSGAVTTSNITVTGGSFSIGSNFSVTTAGLMTAKSGYIGNGSNGWTIGNTALYNTKTGIGDNNESGVYIGTTGIGLGSRNNYGTSSSTDYHAKFEVTSAGALYASNANIDGKITADSGKIGGWTITSGKIYAGDSNTGVAVVQAPSSNTTYVFAAGGNSHSDYSGCPFRVTKGGAVTASNITITGGSFKLGSRFEVNTSGRLIAKTSGGGTLSLGEYTDHPYVSGLNVGSFGIALHGHGIGECGKLQMDGEAVGPSTTFYIQAWDQSEYSYYIMRFKYGVLVAKESH